MLIKTGRTEEGQDSYVTGIEFIMKNPGEFLKMTRKQRRDFVKREGKDSKIKWSMSFVPKIGVEDAKRITEDTSRKEKLILDPYIIILKEKAEKKKVIQENERKKRNQ